MEATFSPVRAKTLALQPSGTINPSAPESTVGLVQNVGATGRVAVGFERVVEAPPAADTGSLEPELHPTAKKVAPTGAPASAANSRRRSVSGTLRAAISPTSRVLLAALLYVGLHEVLGVGFQYLVDLVQQVVQLGLQLLAGLGRSTRRYRIVDLFVLLAGRCRLALCLSFSHEPSSVGHSTYSRPVTVGCPPPSPT
ncbi:hypothetical protein BN381_400045 [Candidatus Microthrix parvicella RN1]|uniref:Uncharacterized protein n=1 Tax=Candidatus Neomicrothrix parvicella RN1 TaxID=1229780 RepID=R4Z6G2_9ACTN|nr:hypothetical protein BN381_400045 [Candidatus Microthrix parvicella RN1]